MSNSYTISVIFIASLILSFIKYRSIFLNYSFEKDEVTPFKNVPWQYKFIEFWNDFVSFFLGGVIGYYFITVRWGLFLKGSSLNISDFVLFFVFALCLFGHLPVLSLNITKGIEAIIKRVLEK